MRSIKPKKGPKLAHPSNRLLNGTIGRCYRDIDTHMKRRKARGRAPGKPLVIEKAL